MGAGSFFRKLFGGGMSEEDEKELDAARKRHGIVADVDEAYQKMTEEQRMAQQYNVWDELKEYRSTFLFGGWLTKKFRVVGEDKVRKQLDDLEKKRRAKQSGENPGE